MGRFVGRQSRRELPVRAESNAKGLMVGTGRFEPPNSPDAATLCRAPLAGLTRESAQADSRLGRFVGRQSRRELPVRAESNAKGLMVGTGRFELPNSPDAATLCRAPLAGLIRASAQADSRLGRFVGRQSRRESPVRAESNAKGLMVGTGRFELPNSPDAATLCRAPLAGLTGAPPLRRTQGWGASWVGSPEENCRCERNRMQKV